MAGLQERFERFTELALTIVHSAAGVFAAGWIEVSCWILTGEQQTTVIRSNYAQVLLNQDMSFSILTGIMETFGFVIGLTNCWQIALITLATGPFIVAAGGISNVFLHRPARISRLEDEHELNLVQIKEIGSTIQSFSSPSHAAEQSCYRPAPQPNELTNIRPTNEQISTSTAHSTSNKAEESSTLKSVTRDKFEKHGDASSEQCVRPTTGSEGAASSNPQPPRLPTFPASALGPWQAVIAYDACARLCLPAWAMQCMEAPHVFIPAGSQERFERFTELALTIVHSETGVFAAGWIEVSCWILTGEQQTTVIRSNYAQVLLNQDMSFLILTGIMETLVPSRINQQSSAEQNGRLPNDEDVLSAPPFCGSTPEIRPTNEQISTSTSRSTSNKAEESSTLKSVTRDKFEKHGDASSEQCVRPATGSEGAASSNPQPPRLPIFPASALGPWQAVIAYDACARLCLPAWAMQWQP
ncbi:hypothetical protein KIW84_064496 [Lathyrus oleraceus]|uniref:ABC transmembrane type-1 domain-containing protein n=1 Tax=Pisum sativum TaxID=3888 RepID=A0A9D4WEH9_PEA|nr:hypothetical protein KIW84_064496 [Pisum sativum]